ncbi:hypothetical protein ACIA8O_30865 [Kitasatospora sp. NPDC051853]|uniref:hypothetical protein n=1 Tax=Kitasatospora sp. NPDC051853 TaxID=3364058 RepID=UPI0037928D80
MTDHVDPTDGTHGTDGITWLAKPRSISFEGYSVTLGRGIALAELAARVVESAEHEALRMVMLGDLTAEELVEEIEEVNRDDTGLRFGEHGEWAFVVKHGNWPGKFGLDPALSVDGAEVFLLEYEEENGKPVPPEFWYVRDGRTMCRFNLHLDDSWGHGEVSGDPEVAAQVRELLAAAGLPDHDRPRREVHRTVLEVLEGHFGLSLPRALALNAPLPAVILEET